MKKGKVVFVIVLIIVTVVVFLGIDAVNIIKSTQMTEGSVSNFEECVAFGNPVMESYPRQCVHKGVTFVEKISDAWMLDDIQLMRHETDGFFGCFGCSVTGEAQALCVDPSFEMKVVVETSERYCNSDFEVVENIGFVECLPEQRNVDACIEVYDPVCGRINIQCLTVPCDSVKEEFSNSCYACSNSLVEGYVEGGC